WRKAMEEEIQALEHNNTWDMVSLPTDKSAIGCKWVYAVKVNPDGSIARLKTRLVAKGYAQVYGVDYSDTFSPVAKLSSIRLLVSLAAIHHWPLYQLDVKNTFLNGDLHEDVYMEQPPGFVAQGESNKVCKLKRSLYGLKQSPRAWFGRFTDVVLSFGLSRCDSDHSVFYRQSHTGKIVLIVCVDDIVITDDQVGISALKIHFQQKFQTKDLGRLKYFLGIEVATSHKGISLSQRKYIIDLLEEIGMLGSKPVDTPMDPNVKLTVEDGEPLNDPEKYRRLVGKLNYLIVTRPDIAFSVSMVISQFMSAPCTTHWQAVLHIVRYLKGAPSRGLIFRDRGHLHIAGYSDPDCLEVTGYSDADWAGCLVDRWSTSGYCVFLGGNLVSWKSKKQSVVSRSSVEAVYCVMANVTRELQWIHMLLTEIGFSVTRQSTLHYDNQSAMHIASNSVFHERTKHIEVDCYFVCEKVNCGEHRLVYTRSEEQLADIFTKPLRSGRMSYIYHHLSGLIPSSLANIGSIRFLDLSHNSLSGPVPDNLFRSCSSLVYLSLAGNTLSGPVPNTLSRCLSLNSLDLSDNHFSSIPDFVTGIWSLTRLRTLNLSHNSLSGPVPEGVLALHNLEELLLRGNQFSGPLPIDIGLCPHLNRVDFSKNLFTGAVPESVQRLNSMAYFSVSNNMLTGRLPVGGVFQSLDQSALQGNLGICSPLLKGPCKMNVPKPLVLDPNAYTNQNDAHRQRNEAAYPTRLHRQIFLSVSAITAISAAILIVCGVIVISLLNVSARRKLAFVENALESVFSSSLSSGSLATGKLILFDSRSSPDCISNPESLLNKAAEIGEGVFGTVYKVSLGNQGAVVSIKKLVTSNIIEYPEDFSREVRVLGKARHPNLISLTGYYWTPQMQLLVSEYAANGSLQAKLHERIPSTPPLSWPNRFNIILGTAKGLAHLHSFRPPIIHYNIKPSNILLDENLNPKISDFGLARLLTKPDKHVIISRFQSALGYVAPEVACQSLRVNEKCDIYGFGILILELVTGRRPVEYGQVNVVILSEQVSTLLEQGNVLDFVDPSLEEYPEDEVLPVLKLALVCTSQIPSSRPSMAEVVQILQLIKTPVPERKEIF
ncbi:LOW QUALITY PROTEIN: Pkinase domain-containing protein/LRR_1 domain-containing protein/RVT_2 domain-containing protein/LRR_8 domain-containing protein, partial [Cephalotus follicularis]